VREPHPLVASLGLAPHPEGGWYRQTWQSSVLVQPTSCSGRRVAASAIQHLLAAGETARWHRVPSDELWLWQGLGPLRLSYGGAGAGTEGEAADEAQHVTVGPEPAAGHVLQALVPADSWRTATPLTAAGALVACVVAPGLAVADLQLYV
jgi:predicted cupin superfamily sugar epimerase